MDRSRLHQRQDVGAVLPGDETAGAYRAGSTGDDAAYRGQGLRGAKNKLTEEDAPETLRILTHHAAEIGKAAEVSVGIGLPGRRQVTLRAPYNANAR